MANFISIFRIFVMFYAAYLIYACEHMSMAYPEFLQSVLRPEINRYFREIWREKSKEKQNQIYEAIKFQYFDNVGKEEKETIIDKVEDINFIVEKVLEGKRLEGKEFTNGNLNREI
mgnify:CR=1 FL=1